jgi:spermidine/putrescine transport system ATP-binding protein
LTDIAAVEAQGVTKVFGLGPDAVRALDNVSVTIRENEFFTLLGPSGCGKTTLLRLIAGFELPTSGDILLHGQSVADQPPYRRAVNTVFQSYALFPHMTVGQNISFGLEMRGSSRADAQKTVDEMLSLVQMSGLAGRRPSQLSGGQQQRVAVARAVAGDPAILLADEPTGNLDSTNGEAVMELLRELHQGGATICMVTHDPRYARHADRSVHLFDGKVVEERQLSAVS